MHLIIDGYYCSQSALSNIGDLTDFLSTFPSIIDMNAISEPQVKEYHGAKIEDWGLSGFVLSAASHIIVHTFPEKRFVNVDIFSCKQFDVETSLEIVKKQFRINEIQHQVISRGVEYLTIEQAKTGVIQERIDILDVSHE